MLFSEIPGQGTVKANLVNLVRSNRLSHALLLLGKEGSGALQLALALAQYVVCEKNKPGTTNGEPSLFGAPTQTTTFLEDSCGNCPSCKKAAGLIHPDIHFSFPTIIEKPGQKNISANFIEQWREFINGYPYGNAFDWLQFIKAENKQGNISADECNEIIKKLSFKSFESAYKVLVLWMPEYLGKEGNKLLKLIEEPPDNTIFILVAASEENILPTILSRCQFVKVPRLSTDEIESALMGRAKLAPEKAKQVAILAEGNYREALHLIQHSDQDYISMIKDWLNAILKMGPLAQLKWVEEMSKLGREQQKQFLKYFNHLLEHSIRLKTMGSDLPLDSDLKDFALRINKIAGVSQMESIVNELDKSIYHIERNANPKMLFMALSIKLYHIIQNKTLILTEA